MNGDTLDYGAIFDLYSRSHVEKISFDNFKMQLKSSFSRNSASFIKPLFVSKGDSQAFCILYYDKKIQFSDENHAYFSNLIIDKDPTITALLRNQIIQAIKIFDANFAIGPIHESLLIERGISVFSDNQHFWGMPTNCNYYDETLKSGGFFKHKDLIEIVWERNLLNDKFLKYKRFLKHKFKDLDIRLKNGNEIKNINDEISSFYNMEWKNSWGFQPIKKDELFEFFSKMPIEQNQGFFAYKDNRIVGFVTFAQSEKEVKLRKKSARAYFIGVSKDFRKTGLSAYLFSLGGHYICQHTELESISFAWMLEENQNVIELIRRSMENSTFSERIYRIYGT